MICVSILFSCKKEKKYEINIINETGVDINNLTLDGTSVYHYHIPANGETGLSEIEWKGLRMNPFSGDLVFGYSVTSYTEGSNTYSDTIGCEHGFIMRDLSTRKTNKLIIMKSTKSECLGDYDFKIEIEN